MIFTLLAFVVALGILITFHELGHYWVARLCGVRVLRFSIGFGRVLLRRRRLVGGGLLLLLLVHLEQLLRLHLEELLLLLLLLSRSSSVETSQLRLAPIRRRG